MHIHKEHAMFIHVTERHSAVERYRVLIKATTGMNRKRIIPSKTPDSKDYMSYHSACQKFLENHHLETESLAGVSWGSWWEETCLSQVK